LQKLSRTLSLVLLHAAMLLFAFNCSAQRPKVLAPHQPIHPQDPPSKVRHRPGTPHSMIGGFWMIDANSKASIYLKNGLETSAITVSPALFLSNGTRYDLAAVTLEPSATSVISINDALAKQGVAPWGILSGYVEVAYSWAWDPLCVTVTSVDAVHSVIFTSGFQPPVASNLPIHKMKFIEGLNTVEGVWWKPDANVTGFVALSNTSNEPANAKVKISNETNVQIGEKSVQLSPHGTKIVQLDELESLPAGATGGLKVQYTGSASTMLINGALEDVNSGFSANLPFHFFASPDPTKQAQETYAELGLMTGPADPMMSFPAGTTFTPFSILRNVEALPVSVTPNLYWMEGGVARSAQLPPFTLAPFSSLALDVPPLLARAGLSSFYGNVNLILDADGPPRSLLLASGSVDAKKTYVFQVFPRGVQESAAKSISYWSTGNGDDTMVTIWNPADEAQDFRFTLNFTGGHYTLPLHLEPRATQTFNISEIVQSQIPDAEGNTIPLGVHEGSAKISGMQADNEQILVALDAGTYNVRKATCSYYCIDCDGVVDTYIDAGSIIPFSVGVQSQFNLHSDWHSGSSYYTNTGTWGSTHTNIATVGSSNGMGTGMSPGSSIFSDYFSGDIYNSNYCGIDPYCPYLGSVSGEGTQTVVPVITSLSQNWATIGANTPITINGTGFGTAGTVTLSDSTIGITYGTRNDTSIAVTFAVPSTDSAGILSLTATNNTAADGTHPTSNPVNFQVIPATPTPVNFKIYSEANLNTGALFFTYTWSSSTGKQSDLSACTLGESVYYPNYPSTPYNWPAPMVASTVDPTVLSGSATNTGSTDTNYPPDSYSTPYSTVYFNATQRFWWQCSNYNGGAIQTLYPTQTILREVFKDSTDGFWKYYISKSGYTNIVKLPNQ